MLRENQISVLINQSGRLRMLSHRASMLLAQIVAGIKDDWFQQELEISIEKFETGFNLIHSEMATEPALNERFKAVLAHCEEGGVSIEQAVSRYLQSIKFYHQSIILSTLPAPEKLSPFLKFVASELLVCLNALVAFFEDILNETSQQKMQNIGHLAKDIENSIDEVDQINLSIKILSFNASVEAARAGEVGRGFAVVSQEMNNLSSNTRKVTQNVKDTVNSFVEQLNS